MSKLAAYIKPEALNLKALRQAAREATARAEQEKPADWPTDWCGQFFVVVKNARELEDLPNFIPTTRMNVKDWAAVQGRRVVGKCERFIFVVEPDDEVPAGYERVSGYEIAGAP